MIINIHRVPSDLEFKPWLFSLWLLWLMLGSFNDFFVTLVSFISKFTLWIIKNLMMHSWNYKKKFDDAFLIPISDTSMYLLPQDKAERTYFLNKWSIDVKHKYQSRRFWPDFLLETLHIACRALYTMGCDASKKKTTAKSLALSFLKIYLLIPSINLYFQYLKFNNFV